MMAKNNSNSYTTVGQSASNAKALDLYTVSDNNIDR